MKVWSHSWYRPGNWKLPEWWTDHPPVRAGDTMTPEEVDHFFKVGMKHKGGIRVLPGATPTKFDT